MLGVVFFSQVIEATLLFFLSFLGLVTGERSNLVDNSSRKETKREKGSKTKSVMFGLYSPKVTNFLETSVCVGPFAFCFYLQSWRNENDEHIFCSVF